MDIDKMEAGKEMDALVAERVMGWIKTDSNLYVGSPLGRVYAVHKFWNDEDELNKEIKTIGDLRRISQMFQLWQPSTDISAAWQVLEKLEEIDPNAIIRVSNGDGDSCDVDILADAFSKVKSAHVSIEGELDDTPLAICRAALKAVE